MGDRDRRDTLGRADSSGYHDVILHITRMTRTTWIESILRLPKRLLKSTS